MEETTRARLSDYIESHRGVVRTSALQAAGLHNAYLQDLVADGTLVRIKRGLYLAAERQTASGFYEVQLALPNSIICLASALAHYDLSTYEPPAIHVAIRRDDRTRPPDYPPTRLFSFGGIRHELGVARLEVEAHEVAIYDREKTICDAIRYRKVLGREITNEAVRRYLESPGLNVDRVISYARQLRMEGPVTTHLRLMS